MDPSQILGIVGIAGFLGGATLYFRSQALIKLLEGEVKAFQEKVDRLIDENKNLVGDLSAATEKADTLERLFTNIMQDNNGNRTRKPKK